MNSPSQGDHVTAFESDAWVDQHGDCLYRYALARVHEPNVAEDLVQETFLAALRGLEGFAGQSTELTWLIAILKRKIMDWFRRQSRQPPVHTMSSAGDTDKSDFDRDGSWQNLPASWGSNPGAALDRQEFWEVFRRCMEKMPERLAVAFTLREIDELSTEEVGQQLDATPGNLGVLLHRARLALRRCLETNWFRTKTDEV
jgi:RNA polymerase sigma-70 factor (TIGR02943 family)